MWNKIFSKHIYPDCNLSASQSKIEFTVNNGDIPISREFKYYIQIETSEGVKLVNNPIPFLFHRIELKVNNNLVDEIENPGIASTILLSTSTDQTNVNRNKNGGFTPGGTTEPAENQTYSFTGCLKDFALGFLEGNGDSLLNTEVKIIFLKNSSFSDCVRNAGTLTPPSAPPSITIKDFYLKTTFFDPSPEQKIALIPKQLSDHQTYMFRRYQLIQKSGVNGSSFVTDITNLYQGVSTPQFLLIGFQDGREGTSKDSSLFDHCNIKNIQVKINGELYPNERQNFDFSSKSVPEAYDMFCDFNVSKGDSEPALSPSEWLKSPIFVIDALNQPLSYAQSKKNIVVQVDFTKPITSSNVVCNILLVTLTKIVHNKNSNVFIVEDDF